jgi:hypothetical protein
VKVASRDHYAAHLASVKVPDDVVLVASYADLVAVRPHPRIVLMQHGIGQSYSSTNPAYPGGRDNDDVGLFLVPGGHPAQRWRDAYPDARVEVVGSPRLDDLPRRNAGPITIAVTSHWRFPVLHHYHSVLRDLAAAFPVIGHGHPRAKLGRFWNTRAVEYVPDFADVCRRADLLIGDNTSALYEFASTGRPVVVLNGPEYRDMPNHGLRFWDAAEVGVNVWHPDELIPAVERALSSRVDDVGRREMALDTVYAYRHGAAERASAAIRDWAA